jgi:hypothetical protein
MTKPSPIASFRNAPDLGDFWPEEVGRSRLAHDSYLLPRQTLVMRWTAREPAMVDGPTPTGFSVGEAATSASLKR